MKHQFLTPPGPLGPFAEGYRVHLEGLGYCFGVVQQRMTQFSQLSRWMESNDVGLAQLDEAQIARFCAARLDRGRKTLTKPARFGLPLSFLRSVSAIPPPARSGEPFDVLLEDYARYLVEERGLSAKTVEIHLGTARRFCSTMGSPDDLDALSAASVISYVLGAREALRHGALGHVVGGLRAFLRYLYLAGITGSDLVPAVPKLASRRSAPQAPALGDAEVARLLARCDRRRGQGRRDYAMLILMARLGLRAGEVAALELDDIDWHHGEILIRGKGNRHERLPLPEEVGAALAAYLCRGRPLPTEDSRVAFLRARAPWRPLQLSGVQAVVNRASLKAGLGRFGPRRLRHTAASRMRRAGLSLTTVAQVMRHHDIRVTTLYVDVDAGAVASLARPWPGSLA